ncbi:MAG: BtpA/SgcQ family protein [Trueperaceae bacterium]|nr:BtpA/SgcQ family protein [Trueperaceae bacterium]
MSTSGGVSMVKPNAIRELFGVSKAVIGVIHAQALPGAPGYRGAPLDALVDFVVAEAERYARGGVDGLILENHGDIPFSKPDDIGPETVAVMSVMADRVRRAVALPLGINVLANGAVPALAVAKAAGASFVRVNEWANAYVANEGIIEGAAAVATRYRSWIHARGVRVFADVHVKHGAHAIVADRSIPELARDAEFFDADVVIATGQRTGAAATLDEVSEIAEGTRLPVVIGSGVDGENVGELLTVAAGVIVASSLKEEGVWWTPVSEAKVRAFVQVVEKLRR